MEFVKVEDGYPECKGSFARVTMKLESGNITRGMFYWNGGKPVFASFGTDISGKVIAWKYLKLSAEFDKEKLETSRWDHEGFVVIGKEGANDN